MSFPLLIDNSEIALRHRKAVALIATRVQQFSARQQPFRIYHGSTNSTRPSKYCIDQMVNTSDLCNILAIHRDTYTALVEPNVPMDKLVEATLQHRLIPPVVMEFPGITVGGGFAGTSGESSSFKYGFFEHTVNCIEVVLPNGEIVIASKTRNSDLFHGAASSFGTLGVTTLLEIQLIEAKTYVELTYHPVSSIQEAMQKFQETTNDTTTRIDYLDGILFTRGCGVVCIGKLKDSVESGIAIQRFSRAKDPWFYLHAKQVLDRRLKDPTTEAVPLVDYLFRYDRGGFWVGSFAFKYFMTPFNRFTRWVLDKFLHTRVMYHALHQSGLSKRYIVQDVGVPYPAADEFIRFLEENFSYYPLWLCPLHQSPQAQQYTFSQFAANGDSLGPEWMLNVGIWGIGPNRMDKFVDVNRQLEHKVQELGGKKWLYAHTYYTEEEFWAIYERKRYDELREKFHATYLPTVYDKVKVDFGVGRNPKGLLARFRSVFWNIWPLRGLYGLLHAGFGGDYLLSRKSE